VYGANQEFRPAGSPGHPETPFDTKIDGFEGQGMNIAVIDSGVDYRHPMFGGIGLTTPLPRTSGEPASPDDNRKVIYFYAFSEPVGDPTDDFGHGTLVASNAAGFLVDGNTAPRTGYGLGVDGRGVGPTPDGRQLFGTAPQARILAYKVCGPAPNCFGDIELSIEDAASPVTLTVWATAHRCRRWCRSLWRISSIFRWATRPVTRLARVREQRTMRLSPARSWSLPLATPACPAR
jgi:subtilisin family serine protease